MGKAMALRIFTRGMSVETASSIRTMARMHPDAAIDYDSFSVSSQSLVRRL